MAITSDFTSIPMGLLICQPIIEVAKGQAELCNVYLDQLFALAFKKAPVFSGDADPEAVEARVVKFKLNRQVIDSASGSVKTVPVTVEAPLLALVPIPAFTMDETTVRFTMEVKDTVTDKNSVGTTNTFSSNFGAWGFSANVTGSVTTDISISLPPSRKA